MSTSGDAREKDACPNCGTRVESTISAPGEPLREATERRCPNCAKVLRREVGGEWTVDETASQLARTGLPSPTPDIKPRQFPDDAADGRMLLEHAVEYAFADTDSSPDVPGGIVKARQTHRGQVGEIELLVEANTAQT